MRYSPHSKLLVMGVIKGTNIGLIKGDTRSCGYRSMLLQGLGIGVLISLISLTQGTNVAT